jgi:hypothetical protein
MNNTDTIMTNALRVLGFSEMTNLTVSTELVRGDKALPCVPPLDGNKVRIGNVAWVIRSEAGNMLTNRHIRSLDVLFEKRTGLPVKVESEWPKGVAGTRFPSHAVYEKQLKPIGQEITGIPTVPPKVPLEDAMRYAMGFVTAKQIIVYYVLESYPERGIAPRAVWMIHVWGCAPVPLSAPPSVPQEMLDQIHPDALNHLRTIVDAQTGEYYRTDSIPQPEMK